MPNDADEAQAEEAYYRAAIVDLFAQMGVIDERIKGSQSETAQPRAETREILGRIQRDMEGGRGQAPPLRRRESGT